jgi:hypothetical protein
MSKLFSLVGATAHHEPGYPPFEPDEADGSFPFPDEVSDRLHPFAVSGRKLWETTEERTARLHSADLAARRDPETLYTAMAGMAGLTKALAERQLGGAPAAEVPPEVSAELEALRKQVAELQGAAAPRPATEGTEGSGPGEPDGKPARGRKPPAAKAVPAE